MKILDDLIQIIVDELMNEIGYHPHEREQIDAPQEEALEMIIVGALQKMRVREGYIFDEESEIEWQVVPKSQEAPGDALVLTVPPTT